jgi:L-fuculose-phosphate aldolase
MDDRALREKLADISRRLNSTGLTEGKSGNVSARIADGFLITPSGVPYADLRPADLVRLTSDGRAAEEGLPPSSEWRFHCDIYRARPEAAAIVHVHSPYATALACARRGIPAFHYMIAAAGGDSIRCAPYAPFGSQRLADFAVAALEGRRVCLLANHGMIALGADAEDALATALTAEELARHYHLALQIGGPVLLTDEEMREALERFRSYQRRAPG